MKVSINWIEADELKSLGHGVEIYYDDKPSSDINHLVAFVDGFQWWRGTSDIADVWLIRSNSSKYEKLGVDGKMVQADVKWAVRQYVPDRKPFPDEKMGQENGPISKHLTIRVNG
jgi:hypothetical protein